MDELEQVVENASPMVKAMAPGLLSHFGAMLSSGQDRKNLEADYNVVQGLIDRGLPPTHYEGLAMRLDLPSRAHLEDDARRATNVGNALSKADSVVDWSKADPKDLNPEFRYRWIQEAQNVSDEELQALWARLLAGELETPGSVSNDTMSIARDLNRERAAEFQILCSMALSYFDGEPMIVVGCGNPGDGSLRSYGLPYGILMNSAHHRLINSEMHSRVTFNAMDIPYGMPVNQGTTLLTMRWVNSDDPSAIIRGILFTPAGEELFRVVEKVHIPGYLEDMIKTLESTGWDVYGVHPATSK